MSASEGMIKGKKPYASQGASFSSSSSSSSSNPAARSDGVMEYWSIGVLEYRAESELHPASVGLGMPDGAI